MAAPMTPTTPTSELSRVQQFLDSPKNLQGVEALGATALAVGVQLWQYHTASMVDLVGLAYGVWAILAPDTTITKSQVAQLAKDGLALYKTKDVAALAPLLSDASAIVAGANSQETKQ